MVLATSKQNILNNYWLNWHKFKVSTFAKWKVLPGVRSHQYKRGKHCWTIADLLADVLAPQTVLMCWDQKDIRTYLPDMYLMHTSKKIVNYSLARSSFFVIHFQRSGSRCHMHADVLSEYVTDSLWFHLRPFLCFLCNPVKNINVSRKNK